MEQSKEQLEKGIKNKKITLGIDLVLVYGNAIMGSSLAGFSLYNLTEGNYMASLFPAGVALLNGYSAYSVYQIVKKCKERIKNEQNKLENIVGEDKPIQ